MITIDKFQLLKDISSQLNQSNSPYKILINENDHVNIFTLHFRRDNKLIFSENNIDNFMRKLKDKLSD